MRFEISDEPWSIYLFKGIISMGISDFFMTSGVLLPKKAL